MCGIAGIYFKNSEKKNIDHFLKCCDLLQHRGPDNRDFIVENDLILVHYRLSILDLNERSNQPMVSIDGTKVCIYNGELYNFKEIAEKYSIHVNGYSDTEVIVESFSHKGSEVFKEWNGIFATCIFDRETQSITLVRDRFGVKPLYYFQNDDVFVFASEAKVIFDWLDKLKINFNALNKYLAFGNSVGDQTMVEGVYKLRPAEELHLGFSDKKVSKRRFWHIENVKEDRQITYKEAVSKTRKLLENAVERQLMSDVPLGILLSGGLDSSTIALLANKFSKRKLQTFTATFDFSLSGSLEADLAKMVSETISSNHSEIHITALDVKNIFEELVYQYDEPFADPASIPLYSLSKSFKDFGKVVLQGDGGDEIFAGYRRYNILTNRKIWSVISRTCKNIFKGVLGDRFKRISEILENKNTGKLIAQFLVEESSVTLKSKCFQEEINQKLERLKFDQDYVNIVSRLSLGDTVNIALAAEISLLLPDRYLEKVDKVTMYHSIESRVPLLDNDLVDFLLRMPSKFKLSNGRKKRLLKDAMSDLLPKKVLRGRKRGFDVPFKKWLKDDLFDFALQKISDSNERIFNRTEIITLLNNHKEGKADHGMLLWKLLVLMTWLQKYEEKLIW